MHWRQIISGRLQQLLLRHWRLKNGPGGPILVVSKSSNPFSRFPLRYCVPEGLNEFAAADITAVTPRCLDA